MANWQGSFDYDMGDDWSWEPLGQVVPQSLSPLTFSTNPITSSSSSEDEVNVTLPYISPIKSTYRSHVVVYENHVNSDSSVDVESTLPYLSEGDDASASDRELSFEDDDEDLPLAIALNQIQEKKDAIAESLPKQEDVAPAVSYDHCNALLSDFKMACAKASKIVSDMASDNRRILDYTVREVSGISIVPRSHAGITVISTKKYEGGAYVDEYRREFDQKLSHIYKTYAKTLNECKTRGVKQWGANHFSKGVHKVKNNKKSKTRTCLCARFESEKHQPPSNLLYHNFTGGKC